MAQYYEVLNQSDKSSDQPFYNNVEDQTVQYVITPDKTQVQYPTQQIVVTTSGDQLMVVDGQPQQIVIDQSAIAYQGQQIQPSQVLQIPQQVIQQQQQQPQQVQVQTQQFAVIQDGNLSNGTQQIFFMEGSPSSGNQVIVEQSVVQQSQAAPQPIVLNHQLGQNNTVVRTQNRAITPVQLMQGIRGANRQPPMQQPRLQMRSPLRNPTPTQSPRQISTGQAAIRSPSQQVKVPSTTAQPQLRLPNQVQVRQAPPQQQLRLTSPLVRAATTTQQQFRPQQATNQLRQPNQVARAATAGQQIRVPSQLPQLRLPTQIQKNAVVNSKFQGLVQIQQQLQQKAAAANSIMELVELESKSNDEQETVSLPDGMNISVASYKKILADHKARTVTLNRPTSTTTQANSSPPVTQAKTTTTTKRKAPARAPRATARGGRAASSRGRNVQQFGSPPNQQQPQQQANNDPARYAMMNQQQMSNSPPANAFQNQQQIPPLVQQQQQQPPQVKPSQANYVIQPPKLNPKPQQKRPLPSYIPSSQIQRIIESTPISEEFSDSIRMLVLLENGEQRLITFTLPKEACTIQEILEQVNVPFQSNTNIQVTEANSNGINYIVTVGNVPPLGYEDDEPTQMSEEPAPLQPPPLQPPPLPPSTLSQNLPSEQPTEHSQSPQPMPGSPVSQSEQPSKASSPEPTKETPKLLPGMLALCAACGYLSEDFARCIRCQRKLPDNVKAIPATLRAVAAKNQKSDMSVLQQQAQQQQLSQLQAQGQLLPQGQQQQQSVGQLQQQNKTNLPLKAQSPSKKKVTKKVIEQESVHVISSDEEDDEKSSKLADNLLQKLGASVTISPVTKEPSLNEIQRHCSVKLEEASNPDQEEANIISTALKFRTVRLGSYRCIPTDKVIIDSTQVIMMVPHPEKEKGIKTIAFEKSEVVKVLASFNTSLPVIFYYLNPLGAKKIRKELDMTADGDYYYDPLSNVDESFRRITFLPDEINEEEKKCIQAIYGQPVNILDELNAKEANDILIKTCPKEVARSTLLGMGAFTEIKQLLTYPPEGRGRISINTEDYVCLAQDQFLNDVIIDFYLKYLVEHLPSDQKTKVHVFSTFFYKRLTTKPAKASRKSQPTELDPTLSPAQKRHARVKTWTKNVNLFEKDFIIVPINENAHWFLAIICFPGMDGCQTWDGKPYKLEIRSRKKKKLEITSIGAVSVTAIKQEKTEKPLLCEDPALSDKDEAEGDESEMDSDDSEEIPLIPNSGSTTVTTLSPTPTPPTIPATPTPSPPVVTSPRIPKEPRPPIKQPCILIFDSLAGANRSRVVATLRDYLTCEYKAKLGKEKIYNKDVIKGANPKVPQQNNFTDCGLYVLQYVEHFFKEPITDYNMPIKQIQHWFEELIVTRKREDIANLIKHLMQEYGKDVKSLPDISFPTINGKIVEHEFEDEEEEEEEEEMMDEDGEIFNEEHDLKDESAATLDTTKTESFSESISSADEIKSQDVASPMKPSMTDSSDFVAQPVLNAKPDLSEFPRQTNKDTLSILKAKRIIRHKTNGPEMKKSKSDD